MIQRVFPLLLWAFAHSVEEVPRSGRRLFGEGKDVIDSGTLTAEITNQADRKGEFTLSFIPKNPWSLDIGDKVTIVFTNIIVTNGVWDSSKPESQKSSITPPDATSTLDADFILEDKTITWTLRDTALEDKLLEIKVTGVKFQDKNFTPKATIKVTKVSTNEISSTKEISAKTEIKGDDSSASYISIHTLIGMLAFVA